MGDNYYNGQQQHGQQQYGQPQYNQQQYNQGQYNQGQYNQGQQWQQQQQPPPQQNNGGYDGGYDQGGYNYGPPPAYSYNPPKPNDEKYGFDQAFKIEKPKYNDLWAGILVRLPRWRPPIHMTFLSVGSVIHVFNCMLNTYV